MVSRALHLDTDVCVIEMVLGFLVPLCHLTPKAKKKIDLTHFLSDDIHSQLLEFTEGISFITKLT